MYFGRPVKALIVAGVIGFGAALVSLRSYQELVRIHSPHTSLMTLKPGEVSYLLQGRSTGTCLGWYHQTLQEKDGYLLANFISLNTELQGRRIRGDVRSDFVFNTLNQLTGGFIRGAFGDSSFGIQVEGIEDISITVSLKHQEKETAYTFSFDGPVEIRILKSGGVSFHFAGQSQWEGVAQWGGFAQFLEAQSSDIKTFFPISPMLVPDGSQETLREECERHGLAPLQLDDVVAKFSDVARKLSLFEVPHS